MKKVLVIYHAGRCIDGFTAAWAAWLKFRDCAEYVAANYDDAPPDVTGREVYILDFSYSAAVLHAMGAVATSLVVLDHHKGAEEAVRSIAGGHYDAHRSGARLAWDHFHGVGARRPVLIDLVEDEDLYLFKDTRTRAVMARLRAGEHTFERWSDFAGEVEYAKCQPVESTETADAARLTLLESLHKESLEQRYPVMLAGIKGLACNAPRAFRNEIGSALAAESGTFGLVWYTGGAEIFASVRGVQGNGCDCIQIAKRYGGSGHESASGFKLALTAQNLAIVSGMLED
ncbi:hypothetical protein F6X40_11040 [Paraburkholderia sp. UCT31]|uniref:hypothetical protein n=1 Tax=Paraburkholderia sp. UCT31 TaxID=2615209 RepID=UPI0016558ED6|nr:hypothetical protein [Paraburkholderia sp. UCT31]MBC8737338.1 hypothetical protein [Paraburkholderia sp. UCT31]